MEEMDSKAKFNPLSPWMATSQTPWIRSYTPSLATFSTYHQSPLSFTYHTPYTTISTLHNQHNNILHTTYHIQQPNYIHQHPICSITWSCRSHAGSCRSHAGCHADTCTLYPYLCCMWLCINHLIPDLSYFPSMTSLFDRLCRHMT